MAVAFNILSFAYFYYNHHAIVFSNKTLHVNNTDLLSFKDAIYFSGVSYFAIGYGDIIAINDLGKSLAIVQGFSGVIVNTIFTSMLVYNLVKRSKNILITKNIFIRYKENQKKFYLSMRIGNKGRDLVNVNKVLEVFVFEDNLRRRKFHLSEEQYYFEKLIYWDIDLHIEENKILLNYLKAAVFYDENILVRTSVIGTDVETGELIFISKYYTKHNIQFIRDYVNLYKWKEHQPSKISWKHFQETYPLNIENIENFERL